MAWIGWRSVRTQQLVPLAQCGEEGELVSGIEVPTNDCGPSATAYREGKAYICNDAFSDQSTMRFRAEFERRGLQSCAAFPISRAGRIRGVLAVYAKEVGLFRVMEVALLQAAADVLSFALHHFARAAVRRRWRNDPE